MLLLRDIAKLQQKSTCLLSGVIIFSDSLTVCCQRIHKPLLCLPCSIPFSERSHINVNRRKETRCAVKREYCSPKRHRSAIMLQRSGHVCKTSRKNYGIRWCIELPKTLGRRKKCYIVFGIFLLCVVAVYFSARSYLVREWEIHRLANCGMYWREGVDTGRLPTKPNSTIFLVDTSGRTTLNARQACSVESAARHNPNTNIQVIMMAPSKPNGKFVSVLSADFPNINLISMCPEFYFKNTPLDRWYKHGEWKRSEHWMREISDAMRYALLWKYGGLYLDTDVIVLRKLNTTNNFLVLQDPGVIIGSSVLSFTQHHNFIERCINNFTEAYNYNRFASVGPTLITNIYKEVCSSNLFTLGKTACGVSLLHPDTSYPIGWKNCDEYFNVDAKQQVLRKVENSSVVHMWGKFTNSIRLKAGVGTPYEILMKENCPSTYEHIGEGNYF